MKIVVQCNEAWEVWNCLSLLSKKNTNMNLHKSINNTTLSKDGVFRGCDSHIFARDLPSLNFLCIFVKLPGHPGAEVAIW